jgi:ribosomal protein S27AE
MTAYDDWWWHERGTNQPREPRCGIALSFAHHFQVVVKKAAWICEKCSLTKKQAFKSVSEYGFECLFGPPSRPYAPPVTLRWHLDRSCTSLFLMLLPCHNRPLKCVTRNLATGMLDLEVP